MNTTNLRVGALVFVLVGHEEEEGVHTWNEEQQSVRSPGASRGFESVFLELKQLQTS